jgi:guanosine-3',5'-bis(diphosphate) 3'-pyrophosphohydrolase
MLNSTLQRIKQHFEHLQQLIAEQAIYNPTRVQATYLKFQMILSTVYEAGEGWIESDVHHILDAVQFAAAKHHTQLRRDKIQTSYLVHPLSVAHHLTCVGNVRDPDIIMAGLLHDTLEDTMTSYPELVKFFGRRVADFVQEVTDDQNLTWVKRKKLQITTAPQKSAGAAQIKLADKWDNLTDLLKSPLVGWSEERVHAYFEWAKKVVEALPWVNAPLLHAVKEIIQQKIKV